MRIPAPGVCFINSIHDIHWPKVVLVDRRTCFHMAIRKENVRHTPVPVIRYVMGVVVV